MAIKTISLELDAYERLKIAKRGNESFSAVVRRARFDPPPATGAAVLEVMEQLKRTGKLPGRRVSEYWDRVRRDEEKTPPVSSSPWGA